MDDSIKEEFFKEQQISKKGEWQRRTYCRDCGMVVPKVYKKDFCSNCGYNQSGCFFYYEGVVRPLKVKRSSWFQLRGGDPLAKERL